LIKLGATHSKYIFNRNPGTHQNLIYLI